MSKQVKAYVSPAVNVYPEPSTISRRALNDDDVDIDITYCGICHTDLHHVQNDWNNARFPLVPGHEILGKVASVGKAVSKFQVGDLVAVGTMVNSCGSCAQCKKHDEQYCSKYVLTYNGKDEDGLITFGGYSKSIVVKEHFVYRVAENIFQPGAAPLLCAGITTYTPLLKYHVGPGKKVGVVGLGGLGHMAIKLAKAMGAYVALFTRSKEKGQDAFRLGADEIIVSSSAEEMQKAAGKFDLIMNTIPYNHDVNPYLNCLAIEGVLDMIGFVGVLEPSVNVAPLLFKGASITGSIVSGVDVTQEMLDFCAKHNILSDAEVISYSQIDEAYKRLLKGDVKYRFVLDNSTL